MTRRLPVVLVALLLTAGATGCGGGDDAGPGATTSVAPTVTAKDVGSLDVDDAKEAAGAVTLCGTAGDVAAAAPRVRRFNVDRPRFQASTIAFPGGAVRAARELATRARAASKECDVYAVAAADVPGLAARGWLANLQPYVEERDRKAPFDAVRVGTDAFGAPLAGGGPDGPVLVVAAASGLPGAALALLDALSGGDVTRQDP